MENIENQAETPEEFSEELTAEEQAYFDNGGVEPEPEEKAEAEAQPAEEQPEEQKEPEKQSMVPHQALHAEREKAKGYKADLEQANERLNKMLEMMQQQRQPEQEPEEYVPDARQDPLGRMEYIDQRLQQVEEQRQQELQEQQYIAQENQVVGTVISALNEANQSDPTIEQAYNHMGNSLRQEALAAGYNDQQAAAWAQEQERAHALFVAQNQLDPANYIKQLATARGWSAKAPELEQKENTEAERIAVANEGMKRQKSLSGVEGAAPANAVDLMSMSDDEFGAWLDKAGEDGWRKEVM